MFGLKLIQSQWRRYELVSLRVSLKFDPVKVVVDSASLATFCVLGPFSCNYPNSGCVKMLLFPRWIN